jgi:predicted NAD-dependent protein-ADP-ribosyltransferase YbiA (DUF1768 family)
MMCRADWIPTYMVYTQERQPRVRILNARVPEDTVLGRAVASSLVPRWSLVRWLLAPQADEDRSTSGTVIRRLTGQRTSYAMNENERDFLLVLASLVIGTLFSFLLSAFV